MKEVLDSLAFEATESYKLLINFINPSPGFEKVILVFTLSLIIALISVFIWKFYKTLSKRDFIKLDLKRYNRSDNPIFGKVGAIFLYIIEYIVIMPFLIFIWFSALSIILLLISDGSAVSDILVVTAAMVAAIRILSYYEQEIAIDVAKMFPFITLSMFLLSPGTFKLEEKLSYLSSISSLLENIPYFLLFILFLEILLRSVFALKEFWKSAEEY